MVAIQPGLFAERGAETIELACRHAQGELREELAPCQLFLEKRLLAPGEHSGSEPDAQGNRLRVPEKHSADPVEAQQGRDKWTHVVHETCVRSAAVGSDDAPLAKTNTGRGGS